jgi:hypothetical protein
MKADMRGQPRRPANLTRYAELCLRALAEQGLGDVISLGGGLGLLHYLDYRPTRDIDAWWQPDVTAEMQQRVLDAVEHALAPYGDVSRKQWGEVVSVELAQKGQTVFGFQIARRSARLQPSVEMPWVEVLVDSLEDIVASKMVALVERGAPRDFRDIYAVCQAGLVTPWECWQLWERRQRLSGSDIDDARARLAVETHLRRIALHRPLEGIADDAQREAAQRVRRWFTEVLLNVRS